MKLKLLGSGQDAGIPHTGCFCEICDRARKDPKCRRLGPSIAIFSREDKFCYLVDASPDFKVQLDMVRAEIEQIERKGRIPVSGILLTHAHPGHISGLWQLGMEALDERRMPVFCTSKMVQLLETNYPYSLLVQRKNIELREIRPEQELELRGFKCTPFQVPHRGEAADTVGYKIESKKSLIYIPDIDHWPDNVVDEIRNADIALIDGSFYSTEELSRYDEVPHPTIRYTMELLDNFETEIYFTHINHTNTVNNNAQERSEVERKGFKIAYDGLILEI